VNPLSTTDLIDLFDLPAHFTVHSAFSYPSHLTLLISCTNEEAICPFCQASSRRIHGKYGRTLSDLPCAGRQVTLLLTVRKFVCRNVACSSHIFTERLPTFTLPYARMTNRLREVLQKLGFATSGEAGARLSDHLGMPVTAPRLIRTLRLVLIPPPSTVRVIGVDDWCWKKGQTYGTILVNLETRTPIDLLPDREAATLESWLRSHPEIEIVSRDRAGAYADAARKGAPQALQVADRFHLLKNLRDGLKEYLVRKQSLLPEIESNLSDAVPEKALGKLPLSESTGSIDEKQHKPFRRMKPTLRKASSAALPAKPEETRPQVSRANRMGRYEEIRSLHQQGYSQRAIARQLGAARGIVRKFVHAECFPERKPTPRKASILDPYKPYLLLRWQSGCWNGAQLFAEIRNRGYTGSEQLLRLFLGNLRKQHQTAGTATVLTLDSNDGKIHIPPDHPPKPVRKHRLSPTRASWLCVSQVIKLNEQQKQQVKQIQEAHADLALAYQLAQEFVMMLAEHRDQDMDRWLAEAEQSGITELKSLAHGIRRDYQAVQAAMSSVWSNGQVEGQVNRLKLQKRMGYGRANFDLLRLRVLARA
jgi:transposase